MTASRVANRFGFRLLLRYRSGVDSPPSRLDSQISAKGERSVSTSLLPRCRAAVEKQLGSVPGDYFASSREGYSALQLRLLALGVPSSLNSKSAVLEKRRFLTAASHCFVGATESLEGGPEASSDGDLSRIGKETASLAVMEYLRDVEGVPEADAEFISRNCPSFISKLGKFVSSSLRVTGEQGAEAGSSHFYLDMFLEKEGNDILEPFLESIGRLSLSTDGSSSSLFRVHVKLMGDDGLLKKTAVLETLGCPRKKLWEVVENNLDIFSWSVKELNAKISFVEKLGVKRTDMIVFVKDPCVFTLDLEERLGPLLQYLDEIGVEKHVLGDLMKFNPQGLIKMPVANFRERVDYLLELGLTSSEVERCMRLFPQLVHLRLANLSEKIEYFDGIGVGKENMVKIVAKLPSIFRHSIAKNLVPKVEMLEGLGLSKSNIAKIIAQYPQFFGCSMDNLKQKLAFFETNGVTGNRLVKLITWHPRAFSFSVDDNLSKKLKFLMTKGFELGSSSMVRALASCLSISTDSLESRFLNLQAMGFTPKEVCDLVKKQPTILCLSEKTIRTKVEFLIKTMGRPASEILKCPGYLLYSLELRIKPRHRVLELLTSKGLLRPEAYSLSTILQKGEKIFEKRFIKLDPECQEVYTSHLVKSSCLESLRPFNFESHLRHQHLIKSCDLNTLSNLFDV